MEKGATKKKGTVEKSSKRNEQDLALKKKEVIKKPLARRGGKGGGSGQGDRYVKKRKSFQHVFKKKNRVSDMVKKSRMA